MYVFLWILGAAILSEYVQLISDRGSFLDSIWGRSKCDSCHKEIPWYALIPLFGWLLSKGSCLNCGKKVSKNYVWFEISFTAGYALILYFAHSQLNTSLLAMASFLFLYCVSWLLMYEDAKNYSVPVSWLLVWVIAYALVWLILGGRHVFWLDSALLLAVLALSFAIVLFRRQKADRDLGSLFGGADMVVLAAFVLLCGFEKTTGILVLSLLSSALYLLYQKRLKIGQRVPLLTLILPWGVLALLL